MTPATARRLAALAEQPPLPIDYGPTVVVVPTRSVPVRAHRRTIVSETVVTSGAERRDAALTSHEGREVTQRCVAYVRDELRALYRSRQAASPFVGDHYVTADDVEHVLRNWPDCPAEAKPAHGPQHWRGVVFRGAGWRMTGHSVPSVRPHMRATCLPCWAPTDSEAP